MSETINILECYSCGAKHDGLPIRELRCAQPPYTHHFTCPTSEDPVLLSLKHIDGKKVEMHHDVMQYLAVAHSHGKYLFVVGYETSPKDMTVAWVTNHFTSARFEEFVTQLQKDFRSHHDLDEGLPEARPAPFEGELQPVINLFSGDGS